MPGLAAIALTVAALIATLSASPAPAAEMKREEVIGGWVGELPCPLTAAKPSASSPTVVPFECVSGTIWDGAWVGHSVYRSAGTLIDLMTGGIHATVDETLVGVIGTSGAAGTLHLTGTVDVDGATNTIVVRERIVGTGAFEGSAGEVVSEGVQVGPLVGHGSYRGTWTRV